MNTVSDPSAPLLISLGDPCGTGPELISAAWRSLRGDSSLAFCVVGDLDTLAGHAPVKAVNRVSACSWAFSDALPVLDLPLQAPAIVGSPDPVHGGAIIRWIETAVALCLTGEARGLITAPIAKSWLYKTGFAFPGHTEFLAHLCAKDGITPSPVMMLTAPDAANEAALRVVLATIHMPLKDVPTALSQDPIVELGCTTHAALITDFGILRPRLVLAGLNPHAGEDGTLGREEIDILQPAVAALRSEGIDIVGPLPADTLFHAEARAGYDAALCLYHDQALIPLKALDFWRGVNVTLGLPIVRTSPDHGTGFSIAGKGVARPDSLIEAIRLADRISRNRAKARS